MKYSEKLADHKEKVLVFDVKTLIPVYWDKIFQKFQVLSTFERTIICISTSSFNCVVLLLESLIRDMTVGVLSNG